MNLLESLISSGRIVDIMLALVAVEVLAVLAWWHWQRAGVPPLAMLTNVGAGGSLMLALRATLVGDGTAAIALWLIAALVFHLADLAVRWRRRR